MAHTAPIPREHPRRKTFETREANPRRKPPDTQETHRSRPPENRRKQIRDANRPKPERNKQRSATETPTGFLTHFTFELKTQFESKGSAATQYDLSPTFGRNSRRKRPQTRGRSTFAPGADLNGRSKYSNESFEDQSGAGFHVNSSWTWVSRS